MIKNTKEHLMYLEFIKVFSAFLIVLQHSISYEWISQISVNSTTWKILNFVLMVSRTGVPLFFMCSGIGMLLREKTIREIYQKNILGIVKIYTSYMLIYGIYDAYVLFNENLATPRTVMNVFIKNIIFGRYHTWFIFALLCLYAITPFLYLITRDRGHMRYFLLLSFMFTILLPYLNKYEALSRLSEVIRSADMHFVVGYSLYFVSGYYLSRIEITARTKYWAVISLFFSLVAGFLLSCKNVSTQGADCQLVYDVLSLIGFTLSTSILLLARILIEGRDLTPKAKSILLSLSGYGIGIYLLHPLFLFTIKEVHGLAVLGAGFLLWVGMLCIMKLISLCPVVNHLFLQR